jgi:hypothetical protein
MFDSNEVQPHILKSDEIESKILSITPSLAAKWLHNNNYGNRAISPTVVRNYAHQMKLGRWLLSPQPIIFSRHKGRLLDGQHRLSAIVESKKTIQAHCSIVKNESIFKVLDQGKNRSNADILHLPNTIVSPIQFLLRIDTHRSHKVVSTDIEPFLNSTLHHRLSHINEVVQPKDKRFKGNPFRAAFAVATCTGANYEKCSEAYRALSHLDFQSCSEMMKSLYYQFDKGWEQSRVGGSNRNNEYFIRGLYMFYNLESNKTTITITDQFKYEIKNKVRMVMDTWRSHKND